MEVLSNGKAKNHVPPHSIIIAAKVLNCLKFVCSAKWATVPNTMNVWTKCIRNTTFRKGIKYIPYIRESMSQAMI